jgi:aldehyde:ferredoxin oxidoreductase
MGKILRVNLSAGTFREETPGADFLAAWLGGRGLAARLVYEEVPPCCDPLGPANKLVFAAGPLAGTAVPGAGRFAACARSPLTGTIFDSNAGGVWGVMLKRCGYDALVIEGVSPRPVTLSIVDRVVTLEDASALWGLDTAETTGRLLEMSGPGASVACIGPAGENQARMAAVINDRHRALGRGGLGAVMGSKKLKSIALRGDQKVPVADPEKLDFFIYETSKWIKASPITAQGLPEFGTAVLVNLINELGVFPSRNFQESQFDAAASISGEALAESFASGRTGCHRCPVQCGRLVKIGAGSTTGPEYESLWALGPQCGIDDLETIVRANALCNELGLDTITTGSTIGCAMEMAEKGLLDCSLKFGDRTGLLTAIKDMACRSGFGDRLAEGSLRLAASCGAPQYAMQVKGLELPAYDPRGLVGLGLGLATGNRGGCHLQAYMVGPEALGVPKMVDRFETGGKAGLAINQQNIGAAIDSLVACRFINLAVSEEYFARLLTAVTGVKYLPQDLHRAGERIWNLERLYNLKAGFTAADDTLPHRLLEEPVAAGPCRGRTVDLEPMLKEFYRFRGWDTSGVPTPKKLAQLGLEEQPC